MQTCPGFFLKSLLESPGNLLEVCSVKFVDTLCTVSTQLKHTYLQVIHKLLNLTHKKLFLHKYSTCLTSPAQHTQLAHNNTNNITQ